MQNSTSKVRVLTGTAMLGAVASVAHVPGISHPHHARFRQAGCVGAARADRQLRLWPVSGILVCLIKNLIKLPSTSTAAVGELFNFVMGALFVGMAGLIYKRNKTRKGAIVRCTAGRAGYGGRLGAVQLLHRLPGLCGHVSSAAGCHHRHVPRPSTPMSMACLPACWCLTCPLPS